MDNWRVLRNLCVPSVSLNNTIYNCLVYRFVKMFNHNRSPQGYQTCDVLKERLDEIFYTKGH